MRAPPACQPRRRGRTRRPSQHEQLRADVVWNPPFSCYSRLPRHPPALCHARVRLRSISLHRQARGAVVFGAPVLVRTNYRRRFSKSIWGDARAVGVARTKPPSSVKRRFGIAGLSTTISAVLLCRSSHPSGRAPSRFRQLTPSLQVPRTCARQLGATSDGSGQTARRCANDACPRADGNGRHLAGDGLGVGRPGLGDGRFLDAPAGRLSIGSGTPSPGKVCRLIVGTVRRIVGAS